MRCFSLHESADLASSHQGRIYSSALEKTIALAMDRLSIAPVNKSDPTLPGSLPVETISDRDTPVDLGIDMTMEDKPSLESNIFDAP